MKKFLNIFFVIVMLFTLQLCVSGCSSVRNLSKCVVVSVEKSDRNFEYAKYKIKVSDKVSIGCEYFWLTDTVGKFNVGDNVYLKKIK